MSSGPVTRAIGDALRARFSAPEWACFFEVPQGTGGSAGRSADAVAMNMYPSRGLRIHGVEVKASRSDWLRELKNPAKAEAIARFCDHWWIAAAKDVVKLDELPPTWGLLELHGHSLRQRVAAPKLDAQPMSRAFIASLLRCASGRAARELREAVAQATAEEQAKVAALSQQSWEVRRKAEAYDVLLSQVDAFENASGFKIAGGWRSGARIGEAVRLVEQLGIANTHGVIQNLARSAQQFVDRVGELMDDLSAAIDQEEAA